MRAGICLFFALAFKRSVPTMGHQTQLATAQQLATPGASVQCRNDSCRSLGLVTKRQLFQRMNMDFGVAFLETCAG